MNNDQSSLTGALNELLNACPELTPAWDDLRDFMGEDSLEDTGIHLLFAFVIMPLVVYGIEPTGDSAGASRDARARAQGIRNDLASEPQWSTLPGRHTPGLRDLLQRLFAVLDRWAEAPNFVLRNAVYVEILESGFLDLSADELASLGGRGLQRLAQTGPRPSAAHGAQ